MRAERILTEHRRFLAALEHPDQIQRDLLAEILRESTGTAYGRELGFPGVRNADDFRKAAPIRTHE